MSIKQFSLLFFVLFYIPTSIGADAAAEKAAQMEQFKFEKKLYPYSEISFHSVKAKGNTVEFVAKFPDVLFEEVDEEELKTALETDYCTRINWVTLLKQDVSIITKVVFKNKTYSLTISRKDCQI